MSPPPPPPPKPYSFDTAGLSAEQIAAIDPDYLRFLRHVRLEAGAYVMEIPSSDGVSPPQVVRYEEEEPLPAPNGAEARVEGSVRRDALSPAEMEPSAAAEVASGASLLLPVDVEEKEPLIGQNAVASDDEDLHAHSPVENDSPAAAAEVPSGASPPPVDVEKEEEPLTGQNAAASHDGSENGEMDSSAAAIVSSSVAPLPVEMGSLVAAEVPSGAALLPDVAQVVAPATSPNDGIGCGARLVEADEMTPSAPEPAWYDSDIDESYRRFLEHYSMEMNHGASTFQMGNVLASLEEAQSADNNEQHEMDEENEQEGQEEEQAEEELEEGHEEEQTDNEKERNKEEQKDMQGEEGEDERREKTVKGMVKEDKSDDNNKEIEDVVGSLLLLKNIEGVQMNGEKEPVDVSVMRTPKEQSLNMEASTSQRHKTMPHNALDLEGIIWPTHIIERQESEFKQKLIKALTTKSFCHDEYDTLFAMATKRSPITKERRTRNHEVSYTCRTEMGKSYFDNYSDLANQVNGESSYPKRLALLRGFFFWLEYVGHDDSFKPWSDDFKTYRVTFMEDDD